jgi:hypothetical protein
MGEDGKPKTISPTWAWFLPSGKRLHSELENPPMFNGYIHVYPLFRLGHGFNSFLLTFTRPGTESSKHFMVVFGMVILGDILGISKSQLTNSLHHFSEG